jgi:hypothetical protein
MHPAHLAENNQFVIVEFWEFLPKTGGPIGARVTQRSTCGRTGSTISGAEAISFSTPDQQLGRRLTVSLSPAADMSAFGVTAVRARSQVMLHRDWPTT